MFEHCQIVTKDASLRAYAAQNALPGEEQFVLSAGDLLEFSRCPSRWIAGKGKPRRPRYRFSELLECLHLTPHQLDARFAFRPDTYAIQVLTCPACGSVTDAAVCRKCKQRRRLKEVQKTWSGNAEHCAKWQARADERNQTVIRSDERKAADDALRRLTEDRAIAEFRDASQCQLWVRGQWRDADTGLSIVLRALIAYWPKSNSNWGLALGGFKTPRDAGHGLWTRSCYYAGYHVHAALALDLYNHATGEDRDAFYFVLSECYEPYEPARRQLSRQFLGLGRKTYQNLLRQYANCLKTRTWPSYDLNIEGHNAWTTVDLEPWMEQGKVDAAIPDPNAPETETPTTTLAE